MSSKLVDYFNKQPGLGTLRTFSKDGKVNSAVSGGSVFHFSGVVSGFDDLTAVRNAIEHGACHLLSPKTWARCPTAGKATN